MRSTIRGGAGIGAALVVSPLLAACGGTAPEPVALPGDYPSQQVPVVGEVRKAEVIEVGHRMWRITVDGENTVAATRALLAAGLLPVAPDVPQNAGEVGAVYRGHGFTVGISSDEESVTYVVSPTPGV
ncbi:hypothetical protein [Tsukamurella sp. 1534]|uniref:hypothetical protein n=1 Tax=Tsukamurella sp. 1534 TaxID=1151061 RepID=UPI0002DE8EAB|nr:hypothetical protein [Tsukamurella sp. 1534]